MITLIVPFYNERLHLRRCISSIKSQTFQDYEVLLIDDLSTDDSYLLAQDLTEGDTHFRLLRNKHKGLFHARNYALAEARGEYFCFLDADDELLPDYLLGLYEDSSRAPVDLVVQGFTHVVNGRRDRFTVKHSGFFSKADNAQSLFASFDIVDMGNVFGKLYKRKIVEEHHLQFSPHVLLSEDMFFVVSYLFHCQTIYLSDKSNYLYIAHKQSMSTYYWDFDTELRSYLDLKRVWELLINQNNCQAVINTYGKFTGNYINRLIYTNLAHPNSQSDRKKNFLLLESQLIPVYRQHYKPVTTFTRCLKWTAIHRLYAAYRWLMKLAAARYRIVENFG